MHVVSRVMDQNNQWQQGSTTLTVHPSSLLVGIKSTDVSLLHCRRSLPSHLQSYVVNGQELHYEFIVCTVDGGEVKRAEVCSLLIHLHC